MLSLNEGKKMIFGNNDELSNQIKSLETAITSEIKQIRETLQMVAEQAANQSGELSALSESVKTHLEDNLASVMNKNSITPEYSQLIIQAENIKMKRENFETALNVLRTSAYMANDKDLKIIVDKLASDAYAGFNLATRLLTEKINAASQ